MGRFVDEQTANGKTADKKHALGARKGARRRRRRRRTRWTGGGGGQTRNRKGANGRRTDGRPLLTFPANVSRLENDSVDEANERSLRLQRDKKEIVNGAQP